ncbi:MAG: hypothetical protein F4130_08275 [Acidobacteria bacterium]|nr:hypothetical protein [Acidobacteriota bacterium]
MVHRYRMFDPVKAATLSLAMAAVASSFQKGIAQDSFAGQSRDSAGIRIVENVRPADDSRLPWRVGQKPSVSIGAVVGDEAYLLHQVSDAVVLPDGTIVVANAGTNELRVFNGSGVSDAPSCSNRDGTVRLNPGRCSAMEASSDGPER